MNAEFRRADDERMAKIEEKIVSIKELHESHWNETKEFRDDLHARLDAILKRLTDLPCREGEEHAKHVDCQLRTIWGIVSFCIIGLLGLSVVWGAVQKQVEINTARWDKVIAEGKLM